MEVDDLLKKYDNLKERTIANNKRCESLYKEYSFSAEDEINKQLNLKRASLRKSEMINLDSVAINKITLTPQLLQKIIRNSLINELKNLTIDYAARDALLEYLARPKSIFARIGLIQNKEEDYYYKALHSYKISEKKVEEVEKENTTIVKKLENPKIEDYLPLIQEWLNLTSLKDYKIDMTPDIQYDMSRYVDAWKANKNKSLRQKALIEKSKLLENDLLNATQKLIEKTVEEEYQQTSLESIKRNIGTRIVNVLTSNGFENVGQLEKAGLMTLDKINGISVNTVNKISKALEILKNDIRQTARWDLDTNNLGKEEKDALIILRNLINIDDEIYFIAGEEEWDLRPVDKVVYLNSYVSEQKEIIKYCEEKLIEMNKNERVFTPQFNSQENIIDSFDKNSDIFINKLNHLCPGLLKKRTYGLPEEIYNKVNSCNVALEGLKADIRSYQLFATKYIIVMNKTIIGDQMGVGKTLEAIAAMVALRNSGHRKFMVVSPAAVIENWERELGRFSDLQILNHYKNPETALSKWTKNGGVLVTSYDKAAKLQKTKIENGSLLVVDEAHYIKNEKARRTTVVSSLIDQFERIALLTGTPMENNVSEMINLVSRINKSLASSLNPSAINAFKRKLSEVYLRRRIYDVIKEMPDKESKDIWTDLAWQEERQEYKNALSDPHPFMKLRRVSWINDTIHSSKMRLLKDLLSEFSTKEDKAIIFSNFSAPLAIVSTELSKTIKVFGPIDGSSQSSKRQQIIDSFTSFKGSAILLGQVIAAGTGLNIQAANTVIFLEPQIKPSLEEQAIARSWRLGQKHKVLSYRLLCANTIDERIVRLLEEKKLSFEAYADESEAGKASLSVEITMKDMEALVAEEKERIKNWVFEEYQDDYYYSNVYTREFIEDGPVTKEKAIEDIKQTIYDDIEKFSTMLDNPDLTAEVKYYKTTSLNDCEVFKLTRAELVTCYSAVMFGNYKTREQFAKEQRAKMSTTLRMQVLRRDGNRCAICGRSAADGVKLTVDHIKPVSKGGRTELNNLQTLCSDCNRGKSDYWEGN